VKRQLEAFKQKVDGVEERHRAAKRTLTEDTEEFKTQQQEWKQTFNRLKGMGSGIDLIGEAVATLGTPATKDDPDVQTFAKTLLTSEK
jgi:hypothetical protein